MQSFFKILRGFFVFLGILFFLFLVGAGLVIHQFTHRDKAPKSPDHITLTLTLAQPMVEMTPPLVRNFAGDSAPPSIQEWIAALENAAGDKHVSAVLIRAVGGTVSLTQAEELRASIARVRAAGKSVTFFTDTFGEMDNGTALYYLAAAADKIILQPSGFVGFNGIGIEQPYARDFLDRNGILPEFEKRSAYKSAMDHLTENHMTVADRAQLTRLLGSLSNHVMQAVARDRKINMDELVALRDAAPLPAAAATKLVDAVQYEDEIKLPAEREDLFDYLSRQTPVKPKPNTPRIALVTASGEIMRGMDGAGSPFSDGAIGAEALAQTLKDLEDEKDITAVIIRLNSPGGSAIASETLNRAIAHLRDHGHPVVISMTDMAASGGYYMAAPATRILAQPSTLTGSIGVIVGKISLGGISKQYGVNWDEITAGKNAALFANGRGFNADERAAVARSADSVYENFKARVAAGRKLSPEAVEAIAQGQVWTGEEALANGLVDELGGLVEAVAATKKLLNLAPDAPVVIEPYPNEQDPGMLIQLLLHQLGVVDHTSFMSLLRDEFLTRLHFHTLQIAPIAIRS